VISAARRNRPTMAARIGSGVGQRSRPGVTLRGASGLSGSGVHRRGSDLLGQR
jgi:hypothetical protein